MGSSTLTLSISLSQALRDHVEQQARAAGFKTPGEYVEALLHEDQERHQRGKLESLLLEGLTSGDAIKGTEDYWENKKNRLTSRHSGNFGSQ